VFVAGFAAAAGIGVLDPSATLTTPLIVDPNAPSDALTTEVSDIAKTLISEPPSAEVTPADPTQQDALASMLSATGSTSSSDASGGGGAAAAGGSSTETTSTTGSSSSSSTDTSAIEEEIKLLSSLVEHGKEIASALPSKEARLNALAAQLKAAQGQAQAQGAQSQLQEQQLLLSEIGLKIAALKQKLEDLQTTQTKLQASITKVQAEVDKNSVLTHNLNQAAAVASVGTPATGGATPAATTTATAASSLLDDEESIKAVNNEARAELKDFSAFSKPFRNLFQ